MEVQDMIISFDLNTIIYIIIIIPIATYLIRIAYWLAESTLDYLRLKKNRKLVNENQKILWENIKTANELINVQKELMCELEVVKEELKK